MQKTLNYQMPMLMGAQLVKEVASKAQDNAGDGTSTAAVLAKHFHHMD